MQHSFCSTVFRGALALLAASASAGATAQAFADWGNPCGTSFGPGFASAKLRLAGATVFLAPASQLVPTLTRGYYRFSAQPPGGFVSVAGTPLFSGQKFYGEKTMSANGRTGYLVAPDIIVTASHGFFDQNAYAIVFDMRAIGTGCPLPDFDMIPAANIIFPPHGPILSDPPDDIPAGTQDGRFDYAAFRLVQPRTDRNFIRLRRSGDPELADEYMHASYPERMSMKVHKNVWLEQMYTPSPFPGQTPTTIPLFANYALMDGSSGGPMYNLNRNFVETSVGSTIGLGCLQLSPGDSATSVMINDCPVNWTGKVLNFGSIKTFAAGLPAAELLVSPLGTVTQRLPLGGTPAQTTFPYEMRVHAQAPAAVNYNAAVDAPLGGQPTLLTMTSSSGTLPVGGSLVKNVNVSAAGITACGTYEQTVTFRDDSHGYPDSITHRLEVGLTDYALDKPASAVFDGVTSPYQPAQLQYTLRNTRPSPTQIKVTHSTAWLRVDGQPLPVSGTFNGYYNLAAQGSPGDSATLTVTLDTTLANALPANLHVVPLSFQSLGACPAGNSMVVQTQGVSLDKRSSTFRTDVYQDVPQATELTSTTNVNQNFCVSSVEVRAKFLTNTFIANDPFMSWRHQPDLYLTAPDGTRRMIWNHTTTPVNWPYEDDLVDAEPVKVIRVNTTDSLPPGSVSLTDFIGRAAAGNWTLSTYDGIVDGLTGYEASWDLKLDGTPGACPP